MSGDAVTVRVSRSLVPFDAANEARAVSQIAAWAEPMRRDFDQAFSREWIEETLRDALRRGLVDIIGVIEAAEKNDDELADNALRAVAGELMERREGRPGEGQILAYLQRHASSPPLRRKRGRAWPSNWRRDFLICAMIEIASRELGLTPTRNRESRRSDRYPSGCSLVVKAWASKGIFLDEKHVQENIWGGLVGRLTRHAFAHGLLTRASRKGAGNSSPIKYVASKCMSALRRTPKPEKGQASDEVEKNRIGRAR